MIDLHLHTKHSDGTDSVKELLENVENANLDIISITDHDSIDAYFELEDENLRKIFSGKIITGVEMKTHYNGTPIEVLGYGVDYNKLRIHKMPMYEIQTKALEEFKERGRKLGFKFDENISISKTDNMRKFASFTFAQEIFKYEENLKILFSIGEKCDPATFYRVHASNKKSVFHMDETVHYLSFKDTIDRIHEAGGLAFLAHPLLYPYENNNKFEEIEKILNEYKLDGLECEYPLFSREERDTLESLCRKYNKFTSGGTDYHAKAKPNISIGTGIDNNININNEYIDSWINKVKIV